MGKTKFVLFFLFSFIFDNSLLAQKIDKEEFINRINSVSSFDKIYVFDSLDNDDKFEFYPQLEKEFTLLKQKAITEKKFKIVNKIDLFEAQYSNSVYKYEKAIETLNNILKQPEGLDQKDSVRLFYLLKRSYLKTKNILKAFESQKRLEELKKKNNNIPFWILTPTLSQMFLEIGLYDQAITQLKQEYASYPMDFSDDNEWANYYNNIGVYFNTAGQADSAIVNFIKAKKRVQNILNGKSVSIADRFFDGLIDGNIGQALKYKKEYASAIPLLKKDIYWSLQKDNLENAARSLNELGECYFMLGDNDLAREKLDSAFLLFKKTDDLSHIMQNIKLKAQLATLSKDYKKANELFASYIKLNDSLSLEEKSIQSIFQKDSFESIENIKKIIDQKNKILETEIELKKESYFKFLLLAGFLIALVTLLYFYLRNRSTKKQKEQLETKNREIEVHKLQLEKSLKEKEILFKEIHHRVKNNMQVVSSLLSLQIEKVENSEAKEILKDGRKRIDSIALIHKLLYENVEINKIKIDEYLNNLVEQVLKVLEIDENSKIRVKLDVDKVYFDLDTTIPIGLIVNELISNSYKYAFPNNEGDILIELKNKGINKYNLLISDNGVGLPWDFETKKNKSLGLELVDLLADQIDSTLTVESNDGVHFKFAFYYPRYQKPD